LSRRKFELARLFSFRWIALAISIQFSRKSLLNYRAKQNKIRGTGRALLRGIGGALLRDIGGALLRDIGGALLRVIGGALLRGIGGAL